MNLIRKIIIAGCMTAVIYGCKKNSPSPDNYLKYKVDGVYKSLKPEADYFDDSLIIDAGKIGGEDLTIFFDGYPAPGVYDLADFDVASISYTLNDDPYDTIISQTGTLVIASYDGEHIKGTFECKPSNGKNIKTITEGEFNTKVEQWGYLSPPDTDSTYSFSAKAKILEHLQKIRAAKLMSGK
ncbi:MAG TPA: DUF6252 family protein [Mucilaginibacter sp.]